TKQVTALTHSLTYFCSLFFRDPPPTPIYTLSLHDALPISYSVAQTRTNMALSVNATIRMVVRTEAMIIFMILELARPEAACKRRSEEHTSELQSRGHLVCRLLLEKKKKKNQTKEQPRNKDN